MKTILALAIMVAMLSVPTVLASGPDFTDLNPAEAANLAAEFATMDFNDPGNSAFGHFNPDGTYPRWERLVLRILGVDLDAPGASGFAHALNGPE